MKKRTVLRIVLFVGVALVVVFISQSLLPQGPASTNANLPRAVSVEDHTIGEQGAPIQVFLYANTECSFCKSFFNNDFSQLLEEHGQDILFVYRHFPLRRLASSRLEAEAAECAYREQGEGAFWEYLLRLYEVSRSDGAMPTSTMFEIAQTMGLEGNFARCMSEEEAYERVQRDVVDTSRIGLRATPSFVVVAREQSFVITGDSYPQLSAAIGTLK